MLDLGTSAFDFHLPDVVSGQAITLASFDGDKALLVMFICRHCPFVKHVEDELARLGLDYRGRGVGIVAISANDVAKAYKAACTPDFFLFNRARTLVYRGQLDDSRPDNGKPVNGRDLRAAIDAVLFDRAVGADQRPLWPHTGGQGLSQDLVNGALALPHADERAADPRKEVIEITHVFLQEADEEPVSLVGVDAELPSVQSQEHIGREKCDALVAIDERMVHP